MNDPEPDWDELRREADLATWRQSQHAPEVQEGLQAILNEIPNLKTQGVDSRELEAVIRDLVEYPITSESADVGIFVTHLLDVLREADALMKKGFLPPAADEVIQAGGRLFFDVGIRPMQISNSAGAPRKFFLFTHAQRLVNVLRPTRRPYVIAADYLRRLGFGERSTDSLKRQLRARRQQAAAETEGEDEI